MLRARFQHLMPDVVGQKSYTLGHDELKWTGQMLCGPLSRITGQEYRIKSAIIFGQAPGNIQELHVDGFSVTRQGASNWALNLPIAEVGEMLWYSGQYKLSETSNGQGLKYLEMQWQQEPQVCQSVMIDKPTVVRIDVPHRVINHSENRRLILSARFYPDIYDGEIK